MDDDGIENFDNIEDEDDYWKNIDTVVKTSCNNHEELDDALRKFLMLVTTYNHQYLQNDHDIEHCCYRLLNSPLFQDNREYTRRQFIYCLLQDDEASTIHIAAAVCLYDGRNSESVFETMQEEGAFTRLIELIYDKPEDDNTLHRLLLELLYEMSRLPSMRREDLASINDDFILYLLQLIEALSDDADDPYHYPVIRVLLIFNEQYMCLASTIDDKPGLTNRILKILSSHGPSYRTFGENLILLLNREAALGPQLLILKLLYLLFTTPSTFEYFYTNDLHVLVDVIIRNLLDLDMGNYETNEDLTQDGQRTLRHTYLRVLCPLLKNTQLSKEGSHYKREELRKLLDLLINHSSVHFAPVDETIFRLVLRCKQIDWLRSDDDHTDQMVEQKLAEVENQAVAKRLLGMSLTGESSLSVLDVSPKLTKQAPSVPAPRRKNRRPTDEVLTGVATNQLKVSNVLDAMQEKERSPFADDTDEP